MIKTMDEVKERRLKEKGWKVSTVSEFLALTPEESALIEIKLTLSRHLKERRHYRRRNRTRSSDPHPHRTKSISQTPQRPTRRHPRSTSHQ